MSRTIPCLLEYFTPPPPRPPQPPPRVTTHAKRSDAPTKIPYYMSEFGGMLMWINTNNPACTKNVSLQNVEVSTIQKKKYQNAQNFKHKSRTKKFHNTQNFSTNQKKKKERIKIPRTSAQSFEKGIKIPSNSAQIKKYQNTQNFSTNQNIKIPRTLAQIKNKEVPKYPRLQHKSGTNTVESDLLLLIDPSPTSLPPPPRPTLPPLPPSPPPSDPIPTVYKLRTCLSSDAKINRSQTTEGRQLQYPGGSISAGSLLRYKSLYSRWVFALRPTRTALTSYQRVDQVIPPWVIRHFPVWQNLNL